MMATSAHAWANLVQPPLPPLPTTLHINVLDTRLDCLANLDAHLLNTLDRLRAHIWVIPSAPVTRVQELSDDAIFMLDHARNQLNDIVRELHRIFERYHSLAPQNVEETARALAVTHPEYNSPVLPTAVLPPHPEGTVNAEAGPSRAPVSWQRIIGHGLGWPRDTAAEDAAQADESQPLKTAILIRPEEPVEPEEDPSQNLDVDEPSAPFLGSHPGKGKKRAFDDREDEASFTPGIKRTRLGDIVKDQAAVHEEIGHWGQTSQPAPEVHRSVSSGNLHMAGGRGDSCLDWQGNAQRSTWAAPHSINLSDHPFEHVGWQAPPPHSSIQTATLVRRSPYDHLLDQDSPTCAEFPVYSTASPTTWRRSPSPAPARRSSPRYTSISSTAVYSPDPPACNTYSVSARPAESDQNVPVPPPWLPTGPFASAENEEKVKDEPTPELDVAGPAKETSLPRRGLRQRRPAMPRGSYVWGA